MLGLAAFFVVAHRVYESLPVSSSTGAAGGWWAAFWAPAAHAWAMAAAFFVILPAMLMLPYMPAPATKATCMPLYKRFLLFFLATTLVGMLTILWSKLEAGHRLSPQSAHAWIGTLVVLLVLLQFVYPLAAAGAWRKVDAGVEFPLGPLGFYVGMMAVWSGIWALLGDDSMLVLFAPMVAVAVTVVRNCTRVAPATFVAKGGRVTLQPAGVRAGLGGSGTGATRDAEQGFAPPTGQT